MKIKASVETCSRMLLDGAYHKPDVKTSGDTNPQNLKVETIGKWIGGSRLRGLRHGCGADRERGRFARHVAHTITCRGYKMEHCRFSNISNLNCLFSLTLQLATKKNKFTINMYLYNLLFLIIAAVSATAEDDGTRVCIYSGTIYSTYTT